MSDRENLIAAFSAEMRIAVMNARFMLPVRSGRHTNSLAERENGLALRRHFIDALNPLTHLNLLGDIPAGHGGNYLPRRVMHPTFGAVVDVRAGLAGEGWGCAFHGCYSCGSRAGAEIAGYRQNSA